MFHIIMKHGTQFNKLLSFEVGPSRFSINKNGWKGHIYKTFQPLVNVTLSNS